MNGHPMESIYREVESMVLPMMERRARALRSVMDPDDAMQEARIELYRAMQRYRVNVNPDLRRYVSKCLSNAFATMYRRNTAQRRMPHVTLRDGAGWVTVPKAPVEFDEMLVNSAVASPEKVCLDLEAQDRVAMLAASIEGDLSLRDREVLWAYIAPPPGVSDIPEHQDIQDYCGINKNQLDWSLHKIRKAMLAAMRRGPQREHFAFLVDGHGWPYLAVSDRIDDAAFVAKEVWRQDLDEELIGTEDRAANGHTVSLRSFRWGRAVSIDSEGRQCTAVMVGRFNPNNGLLFGSAVGCEQVPQWIARAMREVGVAA